MKTIIKPSDKDTIVEFGLVKNDWIFEYEGKTFYKNNSSITLIDPYGIHDGIIPEGSFPKVKLIGKVKSITFELE